MRLVIVSLLAALLSACSSNAPTPSSSVPENFIGIRDGALFYVSRISKDANHVLFQEYNASNSKPSRLIVSSLGGDIDAGLELGEWIRDNNLDVEVDKVCASSCANYVFTAGLRKYLSRNSVLMWHGSAWQRDWDGVPDDWSDYLTPLRARETEFFDSLDIDNQLCTYGQYNRSPLLYIFALFGKGHHGYDYSLEDMARFGIRNIELIDGSWDWRDERPEIANTVIRIEVKETYQFTSRRYEI